MVSGYAGFCPQRETLFCLCCKDMWFLCSRSEAFLSILSGDFDKMYLSKKVVCDSFIFECNAVVGVFSSSCPSRIW